MEIERCIEGYKGFNKDMTCRDFQYEEGKEYTHDGEISICKSGFHFCTTPLDVLRYYEPSESVYHKVEGYGEFDKDEDDKLSNSKLACSKIKIGPEISLSELIKSQVEFLFNKINKIKNNKDTVENSDDKKCKVPYGNCSIAVNPIQESIAAKSNTESIVATSSIKSIAAASGDCSATVSSAYYSTAVSSGNCSTATTSGDKSIAAISGNNSTAASSGNSSIAAASTDHSIAAASDDCSIAATSSIRSYATTSGNYSIAASSGNFSIAATSGDYSAAVVIGDYSAVESNNKDSIAIAAGRGCSAKGVLGSYLVLTEYKNFHELVKVEVIHIDNIKYMADTFYTIKNGIVVKE